MVTDINDEGRLVQRTFAEYLRDRLGWEMRLTSAALLESTISTGDAWSGQHMSYDLT